MEQPRDNLSIKLVNTCQRRGISGIYVLLWMLVDPVMAGYDKTYKIRFLGNSSALVCMHGGDDHYAQDPRELNCGKNHIVCKNCLPGYLEKYSYGPGDQSVKCKICSGKPTNVEVGHYDDTEEDVCPPSYKFSDAMPSWFSSRLDKQHVFCHNSIYGCSWVGSFARIDEHFSKCSHTLGQCRECGRRYLEKNKARHTETHGRIVRCEFCDSLIMSTGIDSHLRFHCDGNKALAGAAPAHREQSEPAKVTHKKSSIHQVIAHQVDHFFEVNKTFSVNRISSIARKGAAPGCKQCRKAITRSLKGGFGFWQELKSTGPVSCPRCFVKKENYDTASIPPDETQISTLLKIAQQRGNQLSDSLNIQQNSIFEKDGGIYYWRFKNINETHESHFDGFSNVKVHFITEPQADSGKYKISVKHLTTGVSTMDRMILIISDLIANERRRLSNIITFKRNEIQGRRNSTFLNCSFLPAVFVQISERGRIEKSTWHWKNQEGDIVRWVIDDASRQFLFLEGLNWPSKTIIQSPVFLSGQNQLRFGFTVKDDWLGFRVEYLPDDRTQPVQNTLYSIIVRYGGQAWHFIHQNDSGKSSVDVEGAVNWLVLGDLMRTSEHDTLEVQAYPLFTDLKFRGGKFHWDIALESHLFPVHISQPSLSSNQFFNSQLLKVDGHNFQLCLGVDAYQEKITAYKWFWKSEAYDKDKILKIKSNGEFIFPDNGYIWSGYYPRLSRGPGGAFTLKVSQPDFTLERRGGSTVGDFVSGEQEHAELVSSSTGSADAGAQGKDLGQTDPSGLTGITGQMSELVTEEVPEEETMF